MEAEVMEAVSPTGETGTTEETQPLPALRPQQEGGRGELASGLPSPAQCFPLAQQPHEAVGSGAWKIVSELLLRKGEWEVDLRNRWIVAFQALV